MASIKEQTSELHTKVEETAFAKKMAKGKLSKQEYVRYLNAQYLIFRSLEDYNAYAELPHRDLNRRKRIVDDFHSIGLTPDGEVMPVTAFHYVNYIYSIEDQRRWNAHVYLHYLGMMFGGALMAEHAPTAGHIYEFHNRTECIKSIRELDIDVNEVKTGFKWQIKIFEELGNVG